MVCEISAAEVESGTGGTLEAGAGDATFSGVSIDTRTLRRGDLFFAIRGPNQDGHRFIPDALSKGALGIVVDGGFQFSGKFPAVLIRTAETHTALKNLAAAFRRRWHGVLVAVTGSMGKTTTRTFAAQVMQSAFSVYETPGNYNNLFGLPLALFGLCPGHDFGIFEMGMSAPGEIAEMCRIAAPVVGILTNVAPAHLAFFNSLEEIALAKGELAESLPLDGMLIYNADDPLVRGIASRYPGRKISFGFSDGADVRAAGVEITGPEETRFLLRSAGAEMQAVVPFAGAHYVLNALPAVALGAENKIPLQQMAATLKELRQISMRGGILRFKEGFAIIDDSYNSNPKALMQMIETLCGVPDFKRRILVAGEMLELGSEADFLHFECGVFAGKHGLDMVLGIQGAASEIVRGFRESAARPEQAHFFADAEAAASFVHGIVRPGDLVLIKGSRGVRTDKIVLRLRSGSESLNI